MVHANRGLGAGLGLGAAVSHCSANIIGAVSYQLSAWATAAIALRSDRRLCSFTKEHQLPEVRLDADGGWPKDKGKEQPLPTLKLRAEG